jgi:putative hydrolase of the HAD superfamily
VANLKAVVFDYGHTLVDFAPAEDTLLDCYGDIRRMLEREAHRDLPQVPELVDALSRRVGSMVEESYRKGQLEELDVVTLFETALLALHVELPRELVRQVAEMEHRAMASSLAVSPETLAVLATLQSMGFRIGLVSNAHFLPSMMREDIERLGIMRYVDDAVFSAEIGVRKPHPAIFLKVLNELQVDPADAVFVGDRLRDDVGGAQGLGMKGVLTRQFRQEDVSEDGIQPDRVIEALPELLGYIGELMRSESPPVSGP